MFSNIPFDLGFCNFLAPSRCCGSRTHGFPDRIVAAAAACAHCLSVVTLRVRALAFSQSFLFSSAAFGCGFDGSGASGDFGIPLGGIAWFALRIAWSDWFGPCCLRLCHFGHSLLWFSLGFRVFRLGVRFFPIALGCWRFGIWCALFLDRTTVPVALNLLGRVVRCPTIGKSLSLVWSAADSNFLWLESIACGGLSRLDPSTAVCSWFRQTVVIRRLILRLKVAFYLEMVSNGVDARLPQLDDPDSPDTEVIGGKKKRGGRATGGEKGGKGLRHFSMKVCEKVESKGRTTYNEVADELVAEFTNPDSPHVSPDQGSNSVGLRAGQQQYDEKNIRRRVYDALNVLMAMNIIFKDKKDIQWKGLPSASLDDVADLKAEGMQIRGSIERKAAYLHELQSQMIGLRNLVSRNERLSQGNNSVPHGGVALPFILVQTRPQATVEVEISEDMQVVHFDFNSTPFELHDDAYVLKAMSLQEQHGGDGPEVLGHTDIDEGLGNFEDDSPTLSGIFQRSNYPAHPSSPYYASMPSAGKNSSWPPVPSILKARVKHESIS